MTCSSAADELWLLLWKSWKTTLRSKGWLALQIGFTLLAWAATITMTVVLPMAAPRDKGDFTFNGSTIDVPDTMPPLRYKCITENGFVCSEDITNTLTGICYNPSIPETDDNYENATLCAPTTNSSELVIRALNTKTIDLEFYALDKSECIKPKHASNQFDNVLERKPDCQALPIFRRIAQHVGNLGRLAIRYLDPLGHSTLLGYRNTHTIMGAYNQGVMFFCLHASMVVSQEATSQIKDYLLSMGMSRTLYFFHHYVFNYLKTLIVVIGSSAIVAGVFESLSLSFFVLSLYALAASAWISFAVLVGACFRKPANSVIVMLIVFWVGGVLPTFFPAKRTSLLSLLYCLSPQYAVELALDAKRENDLRGSNIWFGEVLEAVPQGYYLLMLVFDTILYFLLALLVDWTRSSFENPLALMMRKKEVDREDTTLAATLKYNHELSNSQRGGVELSIEGVHKIYATGEHAVRGVNMSMHKGQVTALLGHNGAGKSTIFSMIAGITVPTEGRIVCLDSDSASDRRKMIGYCPQYNAIFPHLTVDEHLEFFTCLKGAEWDRDAGEKVLTSLAMAHAGGALASQLSGGMKRKLCIAIALAGDSPILLLDEPTAGLDPEARRHFERLLFECKKRHTILLTTHYTDEAEILADRIFIMARGRVFCSGSPQYLKKKFDSGFILSFAVENESDTDKACEEMMKIAKDFAYDDVTLTKRRGQQFEFRMSTDDASGFVDMFKKMESFAPYLGIQSYGLSLTKLEHVFVKVGEMTGTVDRSEDVEIALKELMQENGNRVLGAAKTWKQFGHCLLKRLHFEIAHLLSLFCTLLFIFLITYLWLRSPSNKDKDDSIDLLSVSDHYRIGVHFSLNDKQFLDIERASQKFGKFSVVRFVSLSDWLAENGLTRPPILGAFEKGAKGDWTIHIPPRNELYLPTLEAIAAMANNPALGKVKYGLRSLKRDKQVKMPIIMDPGILPALTGIIGLVSPFMIIRPVSFWITERTSNFEHQERLTGLSRSVLLFSSVFYDFFLYILHFLVFLGACFAAQPQQTGKAIVDVTYLPLLAFLSGELLIVIFYRVFATRAKGFMLILFLLYMAGIVANAGSVASKFHFLLVLNPMVAAATRELRVIGSIKAAILISAHFLLLLLVFILVEWRPWETCKIKKNKRTSVSAESRLSMKQSSDTLILRVNNLTKSYGPRKNRMPAVKGITFGVRSHECFGVLGINGAGKTTTFEMLTGNALPDAGSATVGGVDCSTPAIIGYCPQSDALIDDLTGRQSLVILAALHGYINPGKVARIVLTCVGMTEHADKKTKRYSGGQRRKISVAASLLAQNSLMILDEPTAGIDPIARRDIWSVICALRESTNTAIVLTSHSMDEVEALVSNLIILKEGAIVIEGSPQLIRSTFGEYYNFNLVIENVVSVGSITSHVRAAFPAAIVHDSCSTRNLKYRIPRRKSDVFSDLFERAEDLANDLNATDFSFTQATLEDAFMLAASGKQDITTAVAAVTSSLMCKVKSESLREDTDTGGGTSGTEGNFSGSGPETNTGTGGGSGGSGGSGVEDREASTKSVAEPWNRSVDV